MASLRIGVPSETQEGERRVALVPDVVKVLKGKGHEIIVQSGAGRQAGFDDQEYSEIGAKVAPKAEVYAEADVIVRVIGPTDSTLDEVADHKSGQALIAFLNPTGNPRAMAALAERGVSAFSMELIPRITRAQSMDALSSMSTVAGYKAALVAANTCASFFPMMMTAAGTVPPAKALIIGAGVAGLQAIAICKKLGAVVEAFDVRPETQEQVESLGARFVKMPELADEAVGAGGYAKEVSADTQAKISALIASRLPKNDVVITTALIPGRPAPRIITKEMMKGMRRGSVIVDLAAPAGGNCEATEPGKTVDFDGVSVVGPTALLSDMANDASRMYARNLLEFLNNLAPEGALNINMEDEIIRDTLVTHDGKVCNEAVLAKLAAGATA